MLLLLLLQEGKNNKFYDVLKLASGHTYIFITRLHKMNNKDRISVKIVAKEVQNDEDQYEIENKNTTNFQKSSERIKLEKERI